MSSQNIRNKGIWKFFFVIIVLLIVFKIGKGLMDSNYKESLNDSSRNVVAMDVGKEIVTDEYRILVEYINIIEPDYEQKNNLNLINEDVLVEVKWEYEPLENTEITAVPEAILKFYPKKDRKGVGSTQDILIEEIGGKSSKTLNKALIKRTSQYKVKKNLLEVDNWNLLINVDWNITIIQ